MIVFPIKIKLKKNKPMHEQKCLCDSSVLVSLLLTTSQTRIVLSSDAEMKNLPAGCQQTSRTQLSWPINVNRHTPVPISHNFNVLSREPLTR